MEARIRDFGRRVVAPLRSLGTQPATYPGTPGVQRLPTRLDRDIPRRRTFSNGLDIDKAKAVFETCKNVASEHRRRREEESQDFSFTSTFSEDSIMEEDEDSDVDNDENEITIHPGNIHLLDAPLILTAPAAPRPGEIDLLFLKKEWLKARTSVDIATHEWECQKAQHAYGALWTSIKTASGPLCEPLTFETFPWPMVTAPGAPYDIEVKDVVEFLFSGAKSSAQRQKALDNALKLWHADNFVRLGVVNHICKSDVELVKTGQMIVFSVLQELAGYNFGKA
ncbi:hypothetical protein EXIGLDRAFT_837345 [Exidia glandulosa HHB12029]|uniref:Uncharacterized protein n=1 Tax=Exidia glandulosa HHB12029 TaxID=1314781 RepID=A0A165GUV3_EXIGL|nr:hypothetical protein EXIGLDRAFT_837345 [Exidia glandulosa HHB12029]